MTKTEAQIAAANLIKAGWPKASVEQKRDGSWTAIGEDYSIRPIHFGKR
ncbi:hypothetical protein [Mesorhizobium sp. M2A.F.Ca.ET.039.01.1.1]|nr:hypothetical protein [Mesorhizobium sp. M2A.F.Ca.ET.039.01.1.1]